MKKILVSGVQPSGRLHIGNYFGALKQFVDLQDEYETRIFIANLHALTTLQNPEELKRISRELVLDFLAIGLDPKKVTLYYQSDVPHVTELAWIFSCLTTMPELARAHSFKAAVGNMTDSQPASRFLTGKLEQLTGVNAGTFNYPLLMAADILVHNADVVPVGKDQIQHIEIAREVARDFNNTFGEAFKEPRELILKEIDTVPGTDGRKMSKSYGNTIPLFATDKEIDDAVMKIVTDSGGDVPENVFSIHKSSILGMRGGMYTSNPSDNTWGDSVEELRKEYEARKGNYKASKEALAKYLKEIIGPLRERRTEWAGKMDEVDKIVAEGGKRMREVVHKKMVEVREKVGLIHNE